MVLPQVEVLMLCNDLDDMVVYVLVRKLDKDGAPILIVNIP